MEEEKPIYLFHAFKDAEWVIGKWLKSIKLVPAEQPGQAEYQVNVAQLYEEDPENKNAAPVYDYSFKFYFGDKIAGRKEDMEEKEKLIIKARSLNNKPEKLQVALVMKNGVAFGKIIEVKPEMKEYSIPLSELNPVKTVLLPRPYPSFLPYYFEQDEKTGFNIENVESLQFSIGPGIEKTKLKEKHGVGLISVRLE